MLNMGLTTLSQSCEWAFLVHNDLCVVVHNLDDKTISVISQNCVLSATIVDLHPNSINPVPGDVSIQGWHTHTHQCPWGRSPNIADCCETLVGCEDTREGQPGGVRDTCGHCGRLGHWDPDRGAAPRLPQYVKVILAVTTSTTLFCCSYSCLYSQQHSKPR